MSDRTMIKLNEEQMRDFVANGYISLKPDLPESFHREIYETTEKAFERVGRDIVFSWLVPKSRRGSAPPIELMRIERAPRIAKAPAQGLPAPN